MKTVFVTGATGFIGRHVVTKLLERGCEVRCLVRSPARASHLQGSGARIIAGVLEDVSHWQSHLAGCEAIFHIGGLVAACNRQELCATNGVAVGTLADACSALPSPPVLIHLSSLAASGPTLDAGHLRSEADPPAPVSQYGQSKRAGELELVRRAGRFPITVIRPGIVFGPYDKNLVPIYQMIHWIRLHLLMGFHNPRLSLLHVSDLVDLALAAADRGERMAADDPHSARGIYNACDDREHPTYADLGRRVAASLRRSVLVVPLPLTLAIPTSYAVEQFWNLCGHASIVSPDKLREATATSWAASGARARQQLGFAPRAVLNARLQETADWLREHKRL
jgi:nucleoside-diphosphate-sugar epimerase